MTPHLRQMTDKDAGCKRSSRFTCTQAACSTARPSCRRSIFTLPMRVSRARAFSTRCVQLGACTLQRLHQRQYIPMESSHVCNVWRRPGNCKLTSCGFVSLSLDEIFAGRWRRVQSRPDSFAEQQAKLAKMAVEDLLDTGSDLVEVLQSKHGLL